MLRTWYGAGLIAGIAVFFWGGLAHMALGLGGESTFREVPAAALSSMAANLKEPGLYMFPYTNDPNEMGRRLATSPYGIMVYAPPGFRLEMGRMLGIQAVSDILACLIAAWLLSIALPGLPTLVARVGFVVALAGFSIMVSEVQFWNWYSFPTNFTAFSVAYKLSCAVLAGVVLSLLMGRPSRS